MIILVFLSGAAGLVWEVLWQHHAALSLGVSAQGTAIVLAVTMGGMCLGAWSVGRRFPVAVVRQPMIVYAILEVVIAVAGALLRPSFGALEDLDTTVYRAVPSLAVPSHVLSISLVLLIPAMAMGGTIPVFRAVATQRGYRLSGLYAVNTMGATIGVLAVTFLLLPTFGVETTGAFISCVNLLVALGAFLTHRRMTSIRTGGSSAAPEQVSHGGAFLSHLGEDLIALITGIATFALEVAWFRSLRASFQSVTDSFALMLFAVLVSLAVGARIGGRMRPTPQRVALLLLAAGALSLLATPFVERADHLPVWPSSFMSLELRRAGFSLALLAPAMLPLGMVLPMLLDRTDGPQRAGRLYAINTLGAAAGSLLAAWILLPTIGLARTAHVAGLLLVVAAIVILFRIRHGLAKVATVVSAAAIIVATLTGTGIGKTRAQGHWISDDFRLIFAKDSPDTTVSVVQRRNRARFLVIDGFQTSGESSRGHYMEWMGRLPMLMHAAPKRALVICFGTGQTANGVRQEGPTALDIVDVSKAVIEAAPLFATNEGVLSDTRSRVMIMDGRAWLRRTTERYDVITLEPMDPHFAGTNALYSLEFYRLAAAKMQPHAVMAQWVPFHLLSPDDMVSIIRTFREVFADTVLWQDPHDSTGILLGRVEPPSASDAWPGLSRQANGRDLENEVIRARAFVTTAAIDALSRHGTIITDDNQFLAYGKGKRQMYSLGGPIKSQQQNMELIGRAVLGRLQPP